MSELIGRPYYKGVKGELITGVDAGFIPQQFFLVAVVFLRYDEDSLKICTEHRLVRFLQLRQITSYKCLTVKIVRHHQRDYPFFKINAHRNDAGDPCFVSDLHYLFFVFQIIADYVPAFVKIIHNFPIPYRDWLFIGGRKTIKKRSKKPISQTYPLSSFIIPNNSPERNKKIVTVLLFFSHI